LWNKEKEDYIKIEIAIYNLIIANNIINSKSRKPSTRYVIENYLGGNSKNLKSILGEDCKYRTEQRHWFLFLNNLGEKYFIGRTYNEFLEKIDRNSLKYIYSLSKRICETFGSMECSEKAVNLLNFLKKLK